MFITCKAVKPLKHSIIFIFTVMFTMHKDKKPLEAKGYRIRGTIYAYMWKR